LGNGSLHPEKSSSPSRLVFAPCGKKKARPETDELPMEFSKQLLMYAAQFYLNQLREYTTPEGACLWQQRMSLVAD